MATLLGTAPATSHISASSNFHGTKVSPVPQLKSTVSLPLGGIVCTLSTLRVTQVIKVCQTQNTEHRNVLVRASDAEGSEPEVIAQSAPVEGEVNPISTLKLQSELLKKKAKKLELRRKRLVRKRHMRKKGRWPPSKMKKNKNV